MIKRFLYIFFLITTNFLFGQEVIIIDNNNNPIHNAAVFNEDKSIYVLSDINGVVNLTRFSNNEKLFFQHPKYYINPIIKSLVVNNSNKFWVAEETLYEIEEVTLRNNQNTNNIKNSSAKKIFISKREIEKMNTENLADLLEKKGGISVQKSQLGGGSPNIRGFEANKILLVLDGVRLNNAIYRSGHLQNIITIDESVLESTEVIFGPSSVLYGSDALGGTINMSTKRLYFSNEPKIKTSMFSRYATAYNGFSSHQSILYESKRFSLFNAVSLRDYGDVKMGKRRSHGFNEWGKMYFFVNEDGEVVMNENPDVQKNTGFQQFDIINKMLFKLNDEWRLTSNIQYSTSSNVPRFDKLNDLSDNTCSSCGNNLPKYKYWYYGPQKRFLSSLSFLGFENRTLFDRSQFIFAYQKVNESRNQQKVDENNITRRKEVVNIFSLNTNFKKGNFSYGTESIFNSVSSKTNTQQFGIGSTRYPADGSSTFSSAIYLNYLKRLNKKILLEGGARNTFSNLMADFSDSIPRSSMGLEKSTISASWNNLSGNLKLTYYPENSWKISAVLAKGFHAPNIDDMAKVFVKGNNITVPNINLDPEVVYSQELFISKESKIGVVYFNGFYTQIKNAIIKDSTQVNLNASIEGAPELLASEVIYEGESYYTFSNQNTKRADIIGCTFGFESQIKNEIYFRGDINFTKGINKNNELPVPHIPPTFGKLSLEKKGEKLSYFLDYQYALSKKPEDFDFAGVDNLDETPYTVDINNLGSELITYYGLPKWYTINLSLSYDVSKKINCQFSINNILDEHYKSFGSGISASGRNFITTVRFNY